MRNSPATSPNGPDQGRTCRYHARPPRPRPWTLALGLALLLAAAHARAQRRVYSDPIPRDVEFMYTRGLRHLARTQTDNGVWPDGHGSSSGVVGLAVLAFLANGEDPNYEPYSTNIKRALDYIIDKQKAASVTGYIGSSMYDHGFATLALAEAYGQVDDDRIGPALQKAVKLLLNSQNANPRGAWRYRSDSKDADTTVSGACLVALYAARNAGVEIPARAIKRALDYYRSCQSPSNGGFGYTSTGSQAAPSAIGTLVFALDHRQESAAYRAAIAYLSTVNTRHNNFHPMYYLYYASQAFFQSTPELWRKFNTANIEALKSTQRDDGSWPGQRGGAALSTSFALLSLALNYRLLPIYER